MVLQEENADWRTLGLMLGVDHDTLDEIQSNPGAPTTQQYFEQMLAKWIQLPPDERTWEILCEAVSTCGNKALAGKLKNDESPGRCMCG